MKININNNAHQEESDLNGISDLLNLNLSELGKTVKELIKEDLPFITESSLSKILSIRELQDVLFQLETIRQSIRNLLTTEYNNASLGFTFKQRFSPIVKPILEKQKEREKERQKYKREIDNRIKDALSKMAEGERFEAKVKLDHLLNNLNDLNHKYSSFLNQSDIENTIQIVKKLLENLNISIKDITG